MLINNNRSNLNFQALEIGKAVSLVGGKEITLYKLGIEDVPFANKMLAKIDLEKMYPNLNSYNGFASWDNVIYGAVKRINAEKVFLAAHNNRPCGIIAFRQKQNEPKKLMLSRIATWPIKENSKVPNAGKILMHAMFNFAKENNIQEINLLPISDSPLGKNCMDFYKKLGFKYNHKKKNVCTMRDTDFGRKCAQLENFFRVRKHVSNKKVDLKKELILTFDDTLYEKITTIIKSLISSSK